MRIELFESSFLKEGRIECPITLSKSLIRVSKISAKQNEFPTGYCGDQTNSSNYNKQPEGSFSKFAQR